MDSLETHQKIDILTAHLVELWELIMVLDNPVSRGRFMSQAVDVQFKITALKNSLPK